MNWSAIGGGAITVAFLIGAAWKPAIEPLLQRWLKKYFDEQLADHQHELDKQLEGHKLQLTIEAEAVRARNQRTLQEFGLYVVKKHEAYAELYKQLKTVKDLLDGTQVMFQWTPQYPLLTADEIEERLKRRGVPQKQLNEILGVWGKDANQAQALTEVALEKRQKADIRNGVQDATNYFVLQSLYLSSEVYEAAHAAVTAVRLFENAVAFKHDVAAHQKESSIALAQLFRLLRTELGSATTEKVQSASSP